MEGYGKCRVQFCFNTVPCCCASAVLLTSLAVVAAEPLMEVLLVLHTYSVLAEGEVPVLFSGPLRCWKFHGATLHPKEDSYQQHLNHLGHKETKGGGIL